MAEDLNMGRKFPWTKDEFTAVNRSLTPVSPLLQTAISYKSSIQREIIPLLTSDQMIDVKCSRKNEDVVRMLIHLGYRKYSSNPTIENLYCASIAVATIIKEYEWGIEYLIGDGLYKLAKRVYDNY